MDSKWDEFVRPQPNKIWTVDERPEKLDAAIWDRDGTLASVAWCAPTDRHDNSQWKRFNAMLPFDPVVPEVAALLRSIRPGVVNLMTSGRMRGDHEQDWKRYHQAMTWNLKNDLPIHQLFMRAGGDHRKDSVVKEEIYRTYIESYYNVKVAVDDRQEICDLWRSLGIHVIQVKDPKLVPMLVR